MRYGVDSVMPDDIRKDIEVLKKGESDKRKKVWEEKEGPSKRQKKMTAAEEEKGAQYLSRVNLVVNSYEPALAKATSERKEREAREKEEKAQKAKEEAERLAAEKKKKKPVRYPTEDLDVVLGDRDKKNGMKVRRPTPSRYFMPFGTDHATNEAFLMVWNFMNVYGYVSSFY